MKKLFRVFLILFFIGCCVFSVACDKQQNENDNQSVIPQPSFVGKCVIDQELYDIDDVSPIFYYGGHFTPYIEHEHECGNNYPSFDLFFYTFENGHDWNGAHEYKIKHVDENLVSEKYRISNEWYHEKIQIPSDLLTKDSGYIYFGISGTYLVVDYYGNQIEGYERILGCFIYYEKTDDSHVVLQNVY